MNSSIHPATLHTASTNISKAKYTPLHSALLCTAVHSPKHVYKIHAHYTPHRALSPYPIFIATQARYKTALKFFIPFSHFSSKSIAPLHPLHTQPQHKAVSSQLVVSFFGGAMVVCLPFHQKIIIKS